MRAYGSDRIRPGKGEQVVLFSRRSKGWVPRVPKTLTSAQHPGTAVLCEDRFFEVVSAEAAEGGGVRYLLEPWRDEHVIRVSEPYDEASELRRDVEYRASLSREKGRKAANLLGVFTGHLPAAVQQQLANELGVLPARLTFFSFLLPLLYLIWCANAFARREINPNSGPLPTPFIILGVYLFFETAVRFHIVWSQGRPVGSAAGGIAYMLFYAVAGKRVSAVSPFKVEKGYNLYFTSPDEETALRDALSMREPLLTLLSAEEQAALAQRFGFDYRKHGFIVAWLLLAMSVAGVATALVSLQNGPRMSAILSLVTAVAVGGEQVRRLQALRRGPAASALAVVVRPIARKLLR